MSLSHIARMANIALQIDICEGKKRYPRRGSALIAASRSPYNLRPYRCPICDEWHLTSKGV